VYQMSNENPPSVSQDHNSTLGKLWIPQFTAFPIQFDNRIRDQGTCPF